MKKVHLGIILVLGFIGVVSILVLTSPSSFAGVPSTLPSSEQFVVTLVIGLAIVIGLIAMYMWKLKPWK